VCPPPWLARPHRGRSGSSLASSSLSLSRLRYARLLAKALPSRACSLFFCVPASPLALPPRTREKPCSSLLLSLIVTAPSPPLLAPSTPPLMSPRCDDVMSSFSCCCRPPSAALPPPKYECDRLLSGTHSGCARRLGDGVEAAARSIFGRRCPSRAARVCQILSGAATARRSASAAGGLHASLLALHHPHPSPPRLAFPTSLSPATQCAASCTGTGRITQCSPPAPRRTSVGAPPRVPTLAAVR
jgi:hypothetical protein